MVERGAQSESPGRRGMLKRLAAVAVATLVLLAALEGYAATQVRLPSAQTARDMRLHHTNEPNYVGRTRDFELRFNSQGWREDREIPKEKEPGTYRILYVGDSFVEGVVPVEHTLPRLVDDLLSSDHAKQGLRFEVVNTGTSSYSTVLYHILVRYYLLDYDPDLIVLNVDMTDVADDWRHRKAMIVDANGDPWGVPPTRIYWRRFVTTPEGIVEANLATRLRFFLSNHSHLYRWTGTLHQSEKRKRAVQEHRRHFVARSMERAEEKVRRSWCQYDWDAELINDVAYSMGVVARTIDVCKEAGVKVLLTGVPHYEQFTGDRERPEWSVRPHAELARVAARTGVPYLDSHAALAPLIHGTEHDAYYNRGDFHFNPQGNALWARAHVAAIVDEANGLLPARTGRP